MANDYSVIVPQMLAMGLATLRERLVMARLSLQKYSYSAGQKGSTVEVPVPDPLSATPVAPAAVSQQPQDSSPTVINIPVDQWYESAFGITDKEMVEARSDAIAMQAGEAVKALANRIETHLWSVATAGLLSMDRSHGTAGTTPFAAIADGIGDIKHALDARAHLDNALAPDDMRYVVMNPDAQANLLQQRRFTDMSYVGDKQGIVRGDMGERFGMNWIKTQTVPRHTSAAATGFQLAGQAAAGATQINVDKGAGNFQNTPEAGDVFTAAGSTQQFMVTRKTANKGASNTNPVTIHISPALPSNLADNAALTPVSYVSNLLMHRDYMAFVSKPMVDEEAMRMMRAAGHFVESFVDPISGVALRAQLVRQHYQWRFSYDALWGAGIIRPLFARRIFG